MHAKGKKLLPDQKVLDADLCHAEALYTQQTAGMPSHQHGLSLAV